MHDRRRAGEVEVVQRADDAARRGRWSRTARLARAAAAGRRARAARTGTRSPRSRRPRRSPPTQRCTTHQRQYSAMARLVCRPYVERGAVEPGDRDAEIRNSVRSGRWSSSRRSAGRIAARHQARARGRGRRAGRSARRGRGRCTRSRCGRTRTRASPGSICLTLSHSPAIEPSTTTQRARRTAR